MTKRPRINRIGRIVVAVVAPLWAAAAGAGCRADFAPYNRLEDLRVLAIRSDPPSPGPGETATFSPLIYTPPGLPEPSYSWSWCPFPGSANSGHQCLFTEAQIAAKFPAQGNQVPAFDLGTAPTATLPNAVDPAVLAALCQGMAGFPQVTNCDYGFPVQIALTVTTTDPSSGRVHRVDAVVTGHWRFDPATPQNANPDIDRLTSLPPGLAVADAEEITDPPPPTPLPRGVGTSITAVVPKGAAESYAGLDDNNVPATLRERLFLTWFVETGSTDDTRTSFIAPNPPDDAEEARLFADLQKNSWVPELAKNYPPSTARLYVVIHDNRGGVAWKFGTVNLETAQ